LRAVSPTIRHWFRRTWLRELLVATLLLQALIPAGYMPGVSTDGGMTLQLCSLDHLLASTNSGATAPTGGENGDSGHADHGWCPFASSLHLPPLSTLVTRVVVTVDVTTLPAAHSPPPIETVAARTQLPRGPPALS
jgi:hypothetical protein